MTPSSLRPRMAPLVLLAAAATLAQAQGKKEWPIHDLDRPMAPVITPGTNSTQEQPGQPPSDAIVLFDGKDLSQWVAEKDGGASAWKVEKGYMEVVKGAGSIKTRREFGDCQLHVEWMAPDPPVGDAQDRGNSGVFLMGTYEIQVLDSYQTRTYADGQAGALYGQYPPLVNALRKPGLWQFYDIVFEGPRFDAAGNVSRKARATVFVNGVLVHNAQELLGPTTHKVRTPYKAHGDKGPIGLQDHSHPVRFRNIWVRELAEEKP